MKKIYRFLFWRRNPRAGAAFGLVLAVVVLALPLQFCALVDTLYLAMGVGGEFGWVLNGILYASLAVLLYTVTLQFLFPLTSCAQRANTLKLTSACFPF